MKYAPMLCEEAPSHGARWGTIHDLPEVLVERKWDGWRFMFERVTDGVRSYAGRNSTDRTGQGGVFPIERELMSLPVGTVVDAEVIAPGESAAKVLTRLAHGGELVAMVFDVLEVAGADIRSLPLEKRRESLVKLIRPGNPTVKVSQAMMLRPRQADELHDELVKRGAEGTVSKDPRSPYVEGKTQATVKVKHSETIDVEIIGFEAGKGATNQAKLAAFKVRLESGVETTTKVPDNRTREAVTANPDAYLGRIIELKHYGLSEDGVPRHPTFERWREDKDTPKPPSHTDDYVIPKAKAKVVRKRNYGSMSLAKLETVEAELADAVEYGAINEATRKEPTGDFRQALRLVEQLIEQKG